MKKLSKDEIQKIALSSLLLIGLIYCYFAFLIGPLNFAERRDNSKIDALQAQITDAKAKIRRSRDLDATAKASSEKLAQINEEIPDGAPIAWFPPRIKSFFEHHDIKDANVQIGETVKPQDPALNAYNNVNWTIEIPQVPFEPLGIAIAGLENEQMLLEITQLQMNAISENLENQRVSINAITLLK